MEVQRVQADAGRLVDQAPEKAINRVEVGGGEVEEKFIKW